MAKTNTARKARAPKTEAPKAPTPAVVSIPRMPIPNIAALSNAALAKKISDNGVAVPEGATRIQLIGLAKAHHLWDYKGDVVPASYKAKYGKAQNCGDDIAKHIVGTDDFQLADIAAQNDVDLSRWSHCNTGQKRMNLGNVLRGRIKRGEFVQIGTTKWNADAIG